MLFRSLKLALLAAPAVAFVAPGQQAASKVVVKGDIGVDPGPIDRRTDACGVRENGRQRNQSGTSEREPKRNLRETKRNPRESACACASACAGCCGPTSHAGESAREIGHRGYLLASWPCPYVSWCRRSVPQCLHSVLKKLRRL